MKFRHLLILAIFLTRMVHAQDHLLISEIAVQPTDGEFVEIYNPTDNPLDLSNYYLSDATFAGGGVYYYNIVTGSNAGGGTFSDFHAIFPAGASIAPGEYQTIAMNGSAFISTYGVPPTYELYNTDNAIPDMREALPGSINGQGGLSNNGEMVIVYFWNGQSDLVQDVDYLLWGDKAEAVDKSGVSLDGPDPDSTPSTYLADIPAAQQIAVSPDAPHGNGESLQRLDFIEKAEIQSGGNGITGHNEMSEDLASSFSVGAPNPGSGPGSFSAPSISSISQDPPAPGPEDAVTISADVSDDGMIVSVKLYTSLNSAPFDSTDMTLVGGGRYQSIIAARPNGTTVQYFIRARDDEGLTSTSTTFSYSVTGSGPVTPIADIQANPGAFTTVTIEGVVTLGAGRTITTRTDAYVQDESGRGINIFSFNGPSEPPNDLLQRGNKLQITGTVSEFSGVTEIIDYSITLLSTGNPLPAALELSTTEAGNTALEGTYIKTRGVIEDIFSVGGGTNVTIDDGSGPLVVRVWDDTGIDLGEFSNGDVLIVTAVMDLFQDAAQLTPAYQDELSRSTVMPGDGSGIATIDPDSVGASKALTESITILGEANFTLAAISITIADKWSWSGGANEVQLSGPGLSGANFDIQGGVITVRSAAISQLSPGVISISGLTSPAESGFSTFPVKTAVEGGTLTPIAASPAVQVGSGPEITPIADIQTNPGAFTTVTIEGVVTLGAGIIIDSRVDAYIQDNSGRGINIFGFDPPNPAERIDRFNRLRITGTVSEFNGVTEITDYSVQFISQGNPLPAPLFVSSNLANDLSFEGTYMKVRGVLEEMQRDQDDNDVNLTLRDDRGSVLVRVWASTGINLSSLSIGDTVTVLGVMDVFNNQSQIIPGYQDEIAVPGKTGRADGSGLAFTSASTAAVSDTLQGFTLSLVGVLQDSIETVRLDLPKLWDWSGDPADLLLGGNGLDDAEVTIRVEPIDDVIQIMLSNTAISQNDTARFTFNNLFTPESPLNSLFWIRTAGKGGKLGLVDNPPRVNIGGGNRFLIYDLQLNSREFSGAVTVQGVTTVGAGLLRETSSAGDSLTTAYIQDESGRGINLFRFGLIDRNLTRGNLVEVSGTVTEFDGTTEIEYSSISTLASNAPLPEPLEVSNPQANSPRWDGTLLKTAGVILERFSAGGGTTLEIGDGRGTTNIRIWDTARLDLTGFEENQRIIVEGVSGLFLSDGDSSFQLLPTYQDQVQLDRAYSPTLSNVDLRLPPHPFAPDRGETIEITYNAGAVNNRVTIRIFDLGGRVVTTLLDGTAQLVEEVFEWNGRDRVNELVPLGAYICHLEVIEPVSGNKKVKTAPIVVGTVLSR